MLLATFEGPLQNVVLMTIFFGWTGFSEKRLIAAAEKQLSTLPFYHSFWNRTSQPTLVCLLFLTFLAPFVE